MINDYIFDFAYGEALNDLYWRDGDNKGCKNDVVDAIRNIVKAYANSVIFGECPPTYEATYKTIFDIQSIELKNGNLGLTFGNAQKLLNMTMKYLYIICCTSDNQKTYRKRFSCCHVPMDSVMRDIVSTHFPNELHKDENFDTVSWSQMKVKEDVDKYDINGIPKVYRTFQEAINIMIGNNDCIPLEFDYINWKEARGKSKSEIRKIELGYKMFEEEK